MSATTETDLLAEFYEDMGRDGNPLGTLVGTKQVGDGRSDDRLYVAEVHEDTIIGGIGEPRGNSVVTVWEKLEVPGSELRERFPYEEYSEVYPRNSRSWVKVFQSDHEDHAEAMGLYANLTPQVVEDHRQNEHLEP